MSILDIFSIFHREKFAEADRNLELLGLRNSVAALKQAEAADKAQIAMLLSEISALNRQAADLRRGLKDCADASEEIDAAWNASPYPGNRMHLTLAEQIGHLSTEIEQERDRAQKAERASKLALTQVQAFREAVSYLAERAEVSPEELAQLGLGTLIPGDRKAGVPDEFVFGDLEDAKSAIDFAMHNQATVAKFRQLKEHFVKHQQATTIMLDQLEGIVRKNDITAEDRDRLRSMRDALSSLIGRRL